MSNLGNEIVCGSAPAPVTVSSAGPAGRASNQAVCGSCRGSGQWEEFLPDEVDCMSCEGTGVLVKPTGLRTWDSEAWADEFDIEDIGAFADGAWLDGDGAEIEP